MPRWIKCLVLRLANKCRTPHFINWSWNILSFAHWSFGAYISCLALQGTVELIRFFFARLFQFSLVLVSNCQYIRKYYGLCHTYKGNARVTEVMCVCTLHTSLIYFWVFFLRYDWNLFTLGATIDCHPLLCRRLLACRSITSFPFGSPCSDYSNGFCFGAIDSECTVRIIYY